MLIKDMFEKKIDRDIKGVIKVGQDEDENKKQELEEYVVTNELQAKFRDFFDAYNQSINKQTDNMGVWISGFFGSGKSHFLKIISYLLDDEIVDGKHAIDYFKEDNKINDSMVLANMDRAARISSDVILFNIDAESKSKGNSEEDKDPIVDVFLRVFNKMRGYYGGNPYIAELEAQLDEDGKYREFQEAFQKTDRRGRTWLEARNKFKFVQPAIKQALVEIDYMDEAAAENTLAGTKNPFEISPKEFARLVQSYAKTKDPDHHIVFLVDEVSQYIGNNSSLMLNLQTIVEELGTHLGGRAWVIVTGQEAIDDISVIQGNDFSKIQGRFKTRIALNSHDVEEVIKRRILSKKAKVETSLENLYEANSSFIRNLILFDQAAEMKLYKNGADFASIYPFIPYQFNLLGDVLTAIRENSSVGKHLSEGERSLLASFQESAVRYMGEEEGVVIPFSAFYEPLERFLDHGHSSVIAQARKNELINPHGEENPLVLRVLKALFMIKYVDTGIKPNLNNITTLMVQNLNDDRLKLLEDVGKALNLLRDQQYIEKNLDDYKFLTNEEQDVNREIQKQQPEFSEMTSAISNLLFNDVFPIKDRYRYPKFNGRYTIPFNELVDETLFKNTNFDISVHIVTPNSPMSGNKDTLRLESAGGDVLIISLPDNNSFIDELRLSIQIEKYIRYNNTRGSAKVENIKANKQRELMEHRENAREFLVDALKEAEIFFNGSQLPITKKDLTTRMTEALDGMVNHVYNKLSYIEVAFDESDIRQVFQDTNTLSLIEDTELANKQAIKDVLEFVELRKTSASRTSLKELKDKFSRAPYGFVAKDVEWIIARLFKDGDFAMYYNQDVQNAVTTPVKDLVDTIINQRKADKVQVEVRTKASQAQKRAVVDIGSELLNFFASTTKDDDSLMQQFIGQVDTLLNEINKYEKSEYPGAIFVQKSRVLLQRVRSFKQSTDFYKYIQNSKNDFLDMADDLDEVRSFYQNDAQQGIWHHALVNARLYKDSANVINEPSMTLIVDEMEQILKNATPYELIGQNLRQLNEKFDAVYDEKILEHRAIVMAEIKYEQERVMDALEEQSFKDKFVITFIRRFQDLESKARNQENLGLLIGIPAEARMVTERSLSEITNEINRLILDAERAREQGEGQYGSDGSTTVPVSPIVIKPLKKTHYIRVSNLQIAHSWNLETEEDVEKQLELLRQELLKQLKEDIIVNIQF